jgi:membrane protein YdbS with pleckstrin-like domain
VSGSSGGGDRRPGSLQYEGIQRALFDFLQVPEGPPEAPPGRSEWTRTFRPDPAYLRYLKLGAVVFSVFLGFVIVFIVAMAMAATEGHPVGLLLGGLVLLLGVGLIGLNLLGIRLSYDATWYVMTDEAVRNRRGLWVLKENTVSFDNVQNLSVRQGPLQRYFGIEDLVIETAASGGATSNDQTAQAQSLQIVGVRNASELRDRIAQRMRLTGGSGLGSTRRASTSRAPSTEGRNVPGDDVPGFAPTPASGRAVPGPPPTSAADLTAAPAPGPTSSPSPGPTASPALTPAHLTLLREIRDEVRALDSG